MKVQVLFVAIDERGKLQALVADPWNSAKDRRWINLDPVKLFEFVKYDGMGHCDSGRLFLSRNVEGMIFELKDIEDGTSQAP